ncbi:DNA-binding protein (plasmid) [Cutibacterium acnes]|uniref:DNA-binding protein n=1 Tax=Cutibacterium acnes TaxID=1747 RepID=A0AA44QFQ2_CUTAC|nr:DNA-binding protein [Cutibacterium acnes]
MTGLPLKGGQVYGPGSADPVSQLMLHLLGALAEFERALIHERQAEGIAVAKKQGRYRGRKPALSEGQLARARRLVAEGVPKTKVAAQLGVGRSTLYRALRS